MYGITATVATPSIAGDLGVTAAQQGEIMELLGLLFIFILIALMPVFGLTADSRDSADWKPTIDGTRAGNSY
ncbi:MAG TPA: hypothetical protein VGP57_24595 [Actinoplanes sp.]|jgi:hypothetical protein|nr:hypothetical protein [Actinoplanes sp.]